MREGLTYTVFTDFDGTITRNDLGDLIFEVFGDSEGTASGSSGSEDFRREAERYWRRACAGVSGVTAEEFQAFVDAQVIDAGFHEFAEYCSEHLIPLIVLSDGFDLYIRRVLDREKLGHLPVFSNELSIVEGGRFAPSFPYADEECGACANCKRNHLLTRSADDSIVVYIGNGSSDCCPARYADVVFAKEELLRFCERENVTYHRFESFAGILEKFRSLVESARPRKRRTAELARKEIFMRG
ncbi:MAG TPA: MtnX-like HAD-IB family phosphatase [Bacteroidota bacterium]|nr:MtnX-like HAD-IB family phosphatase [Bacteroidota bacterium]